MLLLANLPALLLVLNLAGDADEESPRGSAVQPTEHEFKDVGFARLHMNREIRFAVSDTQAQETLEAIETAGAPESARGLPYRLELRRTDARYLLEGCETLGCSHR